VGKAPPAPATSTATHGTESERREARERWGKLHVCTDVCYIYLVWACVLYVPCVYRCVLYIPCSLKAPRLGTLPCPAMRGVCMHDTRHTPYHTPHVTPHGTRGTHVLAYRARQCVFHTRIQLAVCDFCFSDLYPTCCVQLVFFTCVCNLFFTPVCNLHPYTTCISSFVMCGTGVPHMTTTHTTPLH